MRDFKHSTTIYLPRRDNLMLVKAVNVRAKELDLEGTVSGYVLSLIKRDLCERGLWSNSGPMGEEITKLEKSIDKELGLKDT